MVINTLPYFNSLSVSYHLALSKWVSSPIVTYIRNWRPQHLGNLFFYQGQHHLFSYPHENFDVILILRYFILSFFSSSSVTTFAFRILNVVFPSNSKLHLSYWMKNARNSLSPRYTPLNLSCFVRFS